MDRNQVRWAILKITALVLLGTTWVFWSFIYATRPEDPSPTNPLEGLMRLPASLPAHLASAASKPNTVVDMNTVDLPCWDLNDRVEKDTSSRWMRLTGKACQVDGATAETVTVRNLSNGYVATVFGLEKNLLTTDYIPLQAGKNEIMIRLASGPGVALESQFTFWRK